jgi:hypothetical protein
VSQWQSHRDRGWRNLHELASSVVGTSHDEIQSYIRFRDVHLVRRNSDVESLVAASGGEEVAGCIDVRCGHRINALVRFLVEDLGLDRSAIPVFRLQPVWPAGPRPEGPSSSLIQTDSAGSFPP